MSKLQNGDLFLVVEKPYLFDEEKYSEKWPEELGDNVYTQMIEENSLEYCIELSSIHLLLGPVRVYTAKEISEEEAYKWYEIYVYYQEGPESADSNAMSLIDSEGMYLFRVKNNAEDLIY